MTDLVKYEGMRDMRVYQYSTRVFKLFLLLWNRLRIRGAEHIPETGGVLFASNHASFLDPPVVGVGYRGRPVHFMARNTLWNSKFGTWWMTNVGCIPVSRGTGDIKALKITIRMLKEGKAVSYELYNLKTHPMEDKDLSALAENNVRLAKMKKDLAQWQLGVTRSLNGKDYRK